MTTANDDDRFEIETAPGRHAKGSCTALGSIGALGLGQSRRLPSGGRCLRCGISPFSHCVGDLCGDRFAAEADDPVRQLTVGRLDPSPVELQEGEHRDERGALVVVHECLRLGNPVREHCCL